MATPVKVPGVTNKAFFNGGLSLVDWGTVDAVDLLAGPITVFTPSADQLVAVTAGADDFVAPDNAGIFVGWLPPDTLVPLGQPVNGNPVGLTLLELNSGQTSIYDAFFTGYLAFPALFVLGPTHPVKAFLSLGGAGPIITGAVWQANTVYAASDAITGPDDHFWQTDGGASGGSIPDFAGNEGGTVMDNGMTWTDKNAITALGSVHLYALVS